MATNRSFILRDRCNLYFHLICFANLQNYLQFVRCIDLVNSNKRPISLSFWSWRNARYKGWRDKEKRKKKHTLQHMIQKCPRKYTESNEIKDKNIRKPLCALRFSQRVVGTSHCHCIIQLEVLEHTATYSPSSEP